ncbi:hypothetical protein HAD_13404 [Hyphomonas adhaerens MHS-3]|uniref:Uncharacterized protein n=1 Tax=Hyphomonas adhaerens MHS-3 TaxID=1280949 RepID=A0A069E1J0_9PROT|nr:hypothetical protein HAD_13404 [Hyphomonas adhaerens MHS-3]
MKKIYDLAVTLAQDPAQVTDAQALTLDDARPGFGLKGVYGLFGSDEWWGNLKTGRMPTVIYEGEIESLQFEGMHNEGRSVHAPAHKRRSLHIQLRGQRKIRHGSLCGRAKSARDDLFGAHEKRFGS